MTVLTDQQSECHGTSGHMPQLYVHAALLQHHFLLDPRCISKEQFLETTKPTQNSELC